MVTPGTPKFELLLSFVLSKTLLLASVPFLCPPSASPKLHILLVYIKPIIKIGQINLLSKDIREWGCKEVVWMTSQFIALAFISRRFSYMANV